MFTPDDRSRLRKRVFELARADSRVTGGAVTGSAAIGAEDRWSDVDTSFGIAAGVELEAVLDDWTRELEREPGVVHHWDLHQAGTIYRVLLMPGGLELNIAVTPADRFGAVGPKFELLFGESVERPPAPSPGPSETIGWGWLYVVNSRTALGRGRVWQAERYITEARTRALELACLRHGEPPAFGRGVDALPSDVLAPYEAAIARSVEPQELRRALAAATERFLAEVREVEPELAERLREPLREAAQSSSQG